MRARALTTDELTRIRDHLQTASARDRCLFEIGVNCGLRVSEIVALDVGQVWQYERPVRRLELTDTKGGVHRVVVVNQKATDAVSALISAKADAGERLDADAPLFTNKDGHRLSRQGADLALKAIFQACQLQGRVTTHSLRRTFATRLNQQGKSIRVIQQLLGHSKLTTTQDYISVTDDELADAVESLV